MLKTQESVDPVFNVHQTALQPAGHYWSSSTTDGLNWFVPTGLLREKAGSGLNVAKLKKHFTCPVCLCIVLVFTYIYLTIYHCIIDGFLILNQTLIMFESQKNISCLFLYVLHLNKCQHSSVHFVTTRSGPVSVASEPDPVRLQVRVFNISSSDVTPPPPRAAAPCGPPAPY